MLSARQELGSFGKINHSPFPRHQPNTQARAAVVMMDGSLHVNDATLHPARRIEIQSRATFYSVLAHRGFLDAGLFA
jgi:hypothetical protein